jgi:hypothetical protein
VAFDQSGPRWLGISDLIAEPEGPTFISYKVARSRLNRLRFVTQDPNRTFEGYPATLVKMIRSLGTGLFCFWCSPSIAQDGRFTSPEVATFRTLRDVRLESGKRTKADVC